MLDKKSKGEPPFFLFTRRRPVGNCPRDPLGDGVKFKNGRGDLRGVSEEGRRADHISLWDA